MSRLVLLRLDLGTGRRGVLEEGGPIQRRPARRL
jgi:hypothetical protein